MLDQYNYDGGSLKLDFVVSPEETQQYEMFGTRASELEIDPVLYNSHTWGINPDKFKTDAGLSAMFKLTATHTMPDPDNRVFTASMESDKYPFIGTQFHPEKPAHLFYEGKGINHSWESIKLNQVFADTFIAMTRLNENYFGDFAEVQAEIIDNYDIIVTSSYYGKVYVFK